MVFSHFEIAAAPIEYISMETSMGFCGFFLFLYLSPIFIKPKKKDRARLSRFKSHSLDHLNPSKYDRQRFVHVLILWLTFLLVSYIIMRLSWPLVGFAMREKSLAQHFEDTTGMLIRGLTRTCTFLIGSIAWIKITLV